VSLRPIRRDIAARGCVGSRQDCSSSKCAGERPRPLLRSFWSQWRASAGRTANGGDGVRQHHCDTGKNGDAAPGLTVRRLAGIYSIAETRPAEGLVDVESLMSSLRDFPIRSFVGSVVLVAIAAASVYLSYELVVKPRQALQDQIRGQKETILKLEQEKQRLEAYLKILKRIDRRARVEVLRQANDQQGSLQTTIRFTEVDDAASRSMSLER